MLSAHRGYWIDGVVKRAWKLAGEKARGTRLVETTVPNGFSDADTM